MPIDLPLPWNLTAFAFGILLAIVVIFWVGKAMLSLYRKIVSWRD